MSGYRVSQMTKTYYDIEAVTKLLDEVIFLQSLVIIFTCNTPLKTMVQNKNHKNMNVKIKLPSESSKFSKNTFSNSIKILKSNMFLIEPCSLYQKVYSDQISVELLLRIVTSNFG